MVNYRLIWGHMKGNRLLYFGAIIATGLATFFAMLGPLVIRVTIDSIIGKDSLEAPFIIEKMIELVGGESIVVRNLWLCATSLVVITIVNGFFQYLQGVCAAKASEDIARNMREKLYKHLQSVSYEYHVQAQAGELIQRCSSDVETLRKFLGKQFVEIGRIIFMIVMISVAMLAIDIKFALVALTVVPIIIAFSLVFYKKIQDVFKLADESEARLSNILQENIAGMRVVRAFFRQKHEIDKYDAINVEYRDLDCKIVSLLALYWSISDFLCMLQVAALLLVGAFWGTNGSLSIGTLVVFLTYEGMLLFPVRQLGRILADMGQAFVSVARIQEILDEPLEIMEENYLKPKIEGEIEFINVGFKYREGTDVLKDISFKVNKGQTLGVLGATGSGKTSLVNLLLRFYDYTSGSIRLDGHELKTIDKKWIRQNISIAEQEPFLFSKTIKENITLTQCNATDSTMVEATKIAAIHDTVLQFEKGYETVVGEKGVTLSGGQKQRVTIARTILNDCPVLIFDDSLSAVDSETDAQIREKLNARKRNVTAFLISHRIATIKEADLIIVLDKGQIIQQGKHEELITIDGFYRNIWDMQNFFEEDCCDGETFKPA